MGYGFPPQQQYNALSAAGFMPQQFGLNTGYPYTPVSEPQQPPIDPQTQALLQQADQALGQQSPANPASLRVSSPHVGFPAVPQQIATGQPMAARPKGLQVGGHALGTGNLGPSFMAESNHSEVTGQKTTWSWLAGKLPSLLAFTGSAVAGLFLGVGLEQLNKDNGLFDKLATGIERVPGMGILNTVFHKLPVPRLMKETGFYNEMLHPKAWVAKGADEATQAQAIDAAVQAMQKNQLKTIAPAFIKRLKSLDDASVALLNNSLLTDVNILKTSNYKAIDAAVTAALASDSIQENKALASALKGLKHHINGGHVEVQEALIHKTATLSAKGVGPVGLALRSIGTYFTRSLSPEANKVIPAGLLGSSKFSVVNKTKNVIENYSGPLLMGVLTFAEAFDAMKNAEPGDKFRTFWHGLLGAGIGGAVGYEISKRAIRSSGIVNRLLGKHATKVVLPGFNVTAGRLIPGVMALFVFAPVFQKMGENIVNFIFGKRSPASKPRQIHPIPIPAMHQGVTPIQVQQMSQGQQMAYYY
ncbi:MAG: hypothetical protein AAGI66_06045 [Cyanobacteria bacterium P01_H01_bin.74]